MLKTEYMEGDFLRSIVSLKPSLPTACVIQDILTKADEDNGTFQFEYSQTNNVEQVLLEIKAIILTKKEGSVLLSSVLFPVLEWTREERSTVIKGALSEWVWDILPSIREIPYKLYVLGGNSIYATDLYLLLRPYLEKHHALGALMADVSLSRLRKELKVQDKYQRVSQLKDKVLNPAVAVLSESFNTNIVYTWVKDKKTVTSIRFTISDIKPIKIGGLDEDE